MADLYRELGVKRDASADDIKRAYRKLAAQLHPDRNPGDDAAESRFKAVNHAYHVLSDKGKRALYDEFGEEGLREGFNPAAARAYRRARGGASFGGDGSFRFEDLINAAGRGGLGDLMGDLFGGRGASGRRRAVKKRGADIASAVTVDFADAIRGTTVKVKLQDHSEPVSVRIPAGAAHGDKLRVSGHGAPGQQGGGPGDLVIAIKVRPHEHFEREGLDLYLDLPITIGEAYHGAKVVVPTPDGEVTLRVPPHAQSGQVVRLKSRGVKRKDKQGDLYVRFLIRLPAGDSKPIQKAVSVLDDATDENVRSGIEF